MLKLLSFFLLCLLFVACSSKSKTKEEDKTQKKEEPVEKPTQATQYLEGNKSLLWEISGKDLKTPNYLYGTIHIIPKEDFVTGDVLENKIAESDYLVMEVPDITNLTALLALKDEIKNPDGKQLKEYVSEGKYDTLIYLLEEHKNMDKASFEATYGTMKPFGLYTLIQDIDMSADLESYEKYFMEVAYNNDLDVDGLETLKDQMDMFCQISYEDIVDQVIDGLSSSEDEAASASFEQMVKYYKMQDLDSLENMMFNADEMMMNDKYINMFLYDRNARWIPKMEEMMKTRKCFFAVGAAHLIGEKGVINLLREQGYTLKPISIK